MKIKNSVMIRSRVLWVLFLLMLCMVFLFGPGAASFAAKASERQHSSQGSKGGVKAFDFVLKDTEGKPFRLSSNKGKRPVMLYFWVTWCPYCRQAEAKVSAMRETYSPEDLEIFAINNGESLEKIKRYREARKLPYVVLLDDGEAVAAKYGLEGVPCFVLISRDGKVVHLGYALPEEKEIKKKLGISPKPAAASGEAWQKDGSQLITRLSDDALEQIMDKAEIVYKISDPVYMLMEEGIVLANRGDSLEAAYIFMSRTAIPSRIEEWNRTNGNEFAKAYVTGMIVSLHVELRLTGGVTEAKIVEFIKAAHSHAERFNDFMSM